MAGADPEANDGRRRPLIELGQTDLASDVADDVDDHVQRTPGRAPVGVGLNPRSSGRNVADRWCGPSLDRIVAPRSCERWRVGQCPWPEREAIGVDGGRR